MSSSPTLNDAPTGAAKADEQTVIIQVSSSGFDGFNEAEIILNGSKVEVEKNEHGHYRGLHIVIINPTNGKVEFAKAFDTYKSRVAFDVFIGKYIPKGHIIVAACKDECYTNLSHNAQRWFANMGSKEISNLEYRLGFAFIGTVGGKEAREQCATRGEDKVSAAQVLKADFDAPKVSLREDIPITINQDFQQKAQTALKMP